MEQNSTMRRLLIGLLILAVGGAILLNNLGVLSYDIKRYFLQWEVLLILLGFIFVISHDHKIPGVLLILVGGVLYLRNFLDLDFNFWQIFWPALLIIIGVMIILHRRFDPSRCEKKSIGDEDIIDEVAVFGGGDKTILSQNFQGGKVLAIFGGSNFNLSRARLSPGRNYIDIMAVFGGLKLIVPEDWNVKINVMSIFGGFSDKHRIQPRNEDSKPDSELIIKGFVIFGGGEIKSF